MEESKIDERQKNRLVFRQPKLCTIAHTMECYATKLRKNKRQHIINTRRAKFINELTENSLYHNELEVRTIVRFLQEEPYFIDQSPSSVFVLNNSN